MAAGNSFLPSPAPSATASGSDLTVPWPRVEAFVGQLIHDVRNGLNAIELQLTYLGEISSDPEAIEEVKHLRGTLQEVTRQMQVVKTACGAISPHVMEYPAADFFEYIRDRLGRQHPETVGAVTWKVDTDPSGDLLVDPDLSIIGLLELFKNAFRFAGTGIQCTTVREDDRILFILRETTVAAPPISPGRWGREPFLTSRRGAYGLGLFRARQIFEIQGGALEAVYSEADHALTTTVSLPRPPRAD